MPIEYHVVTYVNRGGALESVAHGRVRTLEARGVEGDATKALLGHVQNHQCDGAASCGGCMRLHAFAEERVVSRLVRPAEVAVAWRKYHPLVAQGVAKPGAPFEFVKDDTHVRVEVRTIDATSQAAGPEQKTISPVALAKFEAELAVMAQAAKARADIRDVYAQFASDVGAKLQQLNDAQRRYANLPAQAEIAKRFADTRAAIAGYDEAAQLALKNILAAPLQVNAKPMLAQAVAQQAALVDAAMSVVGHIAQTNAQRLQLIAAAEAGLARVDVLAKEIAAAHKELPSIDLPALELGALAAEAKLTLERVSVQDAQAANASNAALAAKIEATSGRLTEAVRAAKVERATFDKRTERVNAWREPAGRAQLLAWVDSGSALAGFAVPHFRAQAEALKVTAFEPVPLGQYTDAKAKVALASGERALAPLTVLEEKIRDEMERRAGDMYSPTVVSGVSFIAPTMRVIVNRARADGSVDASVRIQNNHAHAMTVTIAAGPQRHDVVLPAHGAVAVLELENASNPFSCTVDCVAASDDVDAHGNTNGYRLNVPSAEVRIENAGAARSILPTWYTPPANPAAAPITWSNQPTPNVSYTSHPVPGLSGARP